ncbi:hypothetical protein FNF28_03812 [Cafeteria roenbergensis]|uniref:Glycosyltransferase 2-like domain-containing protein n=1 Tax=Cafeteria roenbergensis TaxID=33653 RepID=A0A5A8DKR6_CAFRO|nr:hypothetical protein FNF28_03812 [Cafeteria roenbergensis]
MEGTSVARDILVSVIIPVHNSSAYLDECLESVAAQTHRPVQVVAFDDCSTDDSLSKLAEWKARIDRLDGMACVVLSGAAQGQTRARGAGFGRNRCVEASSGSVLAMLDSDDAMEPRRLELQLELLLAEEAKGVLVGAQVTRVPAGSTAKYTAWINEMPAAELWLQQYREVTLFPEDLLFVHCLWAAGGRPARVDEPLVRYRCTPGSVSWNIPRRALLAVKAAAFEVRELGLPGPLGAEGVGGGHGWEQLTPESQARAVECAARAAAEAAAPARPLAGGFSVWSAGRDGSQFMASLSPEALALVRCAGDVDPKKIEARFVAVTPGFQPGAAVVKVPVIPVAEMEAPVVTCVVLTSGSEFEKGLGAWMRARGALRGADVIHMA